MEENPRKQHLRAEVVDGRLVVSIGVESLAFVAERQPGMEWCDPRPPYDCHRPVVTDPDVFAKTVCAVIQYQGVRDATPLTTLIDRGIELAAEDCDSAFQLANRSTPLWDAP